MRTPLAKTFAVLPLAALLMAGCGHKDSDDSAGSTATPAASTAPATAPAGTSPTPPGPTPAGKDMTGLNGKGAGDNKTVGQPLTTMKIKNALLADKTVGATGINVSTSAEGQVSLTGNVPSAAASAKAESIAKATPGVKKVVNALKVVKQ